MEDKIPNKPCPACNALSGFSEKGGYYIFNCPEHGEFHISKLDSIITKPNQYQSDLLNKELNAARDSGRSGPLKILQRPTIVELD